MPGHRGQYQPMESGGDSMDKPALNPIMGSGSCPRPRLLHPPIPRVPGQVGWARVESPRAAAQVHGGRACLSLDWAFKSFLPLDLTFFFATSSPRCERAQLPVQVQGVGGARTRGGRGSAFTEGVPHPGAEPGASWAAGQDWAHGDVATVTPVARMFEAREENPGTVRRHTGGVKKSKSKFLEPKRGKKLRCLR